MSKFFCKRCSKMITVIDEQKEQKCPYCNVVYEYTYDGGWKYEIKGYRTRKCLYCKGNIFIKIDSEKNEKVEKCKCGECGNEHLVDWISNLCTLVPCNILQIKCAWCDENLSLDISKTTQKWIETRNGQYQQEQIICSCCGGQSKVTFGVGMGHPVYMTDIHRVQRRGRKRKVDLKLIENFVYSNSIYKTYEIIHPYSVCNFCEKNHLSEDEVFEVIENMKIPIFIPMEMGELAGHKYENEFSKLILKEDAMTNAGGASLSGLMGRTKAWRELRNILLENEDYTCEICGYRANTENAKALHIHEEWEQEDNVVTLKKVSLICARCHACKHVNNFVIYRVQDGGSELVEGIPRIDFITIHLMKVNNVEKEVIYAYRKQLHKKWKEMEEDKREASRNGVGDEIKEYKYIISENIPNRKEIIEYLKKRGMLL